MLRLLRGGCKGNWEGLKGGSGIDLREVTDHVRRKHGSRDEGHVNVFHGKRLGGFVRSMF